MKPFNIELYSRCAEEELRRIAGATKCDADQLREFARDGLERLKRRYRYNGYAYLRRDQREARAEKVT